MKHRVKTNVLVLAIGLLMALRANALIASGTGSPTYTNGWPEGAAAVSNLKSCVGWWEGPPFGGGEWHIQFRGDAEALNQALTNFAAIRAPALDLVIHDGPQHDQFLNNDTRVDWSFTVWNPESWHRLYNNPKVIFNAGEPGFRQPVPPPRLDVYIGGRVDWAKVKIPAGLLVRDERVSAIAANSINRAALSVVVYDMATGKPVTNAHLTLSLWTPARTNYQEVAKADGDKSGHFEISKIEPGSHLVAIEANGYSTRLLRNLIMDGHTPQNICVELAKQSSFSGTVTDMDGKPIKGAEIRTISVLGFNGRGYELPDTSAAKTDEAGHFELAGLPKGFIQLVVRACGYFFTDLATIRDVPATNEVLRMARAGSIRVTVTDKTGHSLSRYEDHELLVEAKPTGGEQIGWPNGTIFVSENGVADFSNRPPGEYHITSRPNPGTREKYTSEQIVTVKPGECAEVKMVYE
jgi:hypothetical protein